MFTANRSQDGSPRAGARQPPRPAQAHARGACPPSARGNPVWGDSVAPHGIKKPPSTTEDIEPSAHRREKREPLTCTYRLMKRQDARERSSTLDLSCGKDVRGRCPSTPAGDTPAPRKTRHARAGRPRPAFQLWDISVFVARPPRQRRRKTIKISKGEILIARH